MSSLCCYITYNWTDANMRPTSPLWHCVPRKAKKRKEEKRKEGEKRVDKSSMTVEPEGLPSPSQAPTDLAVQGWDTRDFPAEARHLSFPAQPEVPASLATTLHLPASDERSYPRSVEHSSPPGLPNP